jgi:class 3 adenylate cyclase
MDSRPDIRYARSGGVHIAHQTWGSGAPFVGIPPFAQNIERCWDDPTDLFPQFLRRFGAFSTTTHFDKRGTGLSDRVAGGGIEERIEDIRAVMDDVGIERANIGGISEGGPMAMLFAATYPERVDKLLLFATAARFVQGPDYPYGVSPDEFQFVADEVVEKWARPESLLVPIWMPSLADDIGFRRWELGYERACASPGAVREAFDYIGKIDVRSVLSAIQAPTLVMHRTGDLVVDVAHGRYVAEHIPNARFVEFPGIDHVPWVGDADQFMDHAEEFVTGAPPAPVETGRFLATVLFTDIVDSTKQATELGDHRWHTLLDRHDRAVRQELDRFGGREVKMTGDGFLATFDSPSRALRAAQAIIDAAGEAGVSIRAGLHTGEIEQRGDDIAGLAVHVAARIAALAGPSEVLLSSTVKDLVLGSEFRLLDHGSHHLKGVEGQWRLLSLT